MSRPALLGADDEPHTTEESDIADEAIVRCSDLGVRFGDATVLDGIELTVQAGEVLVLLGPSGCGKTTLLRTIAGLEKPTSGTVHIEGRDVTGIAPERRGVAMVFQNYALYPEKTVSGNIEFPLRMQGVAAAERKRRVREISQLLRLDSLLQRKPAQLSGGQQQRVGIGRALVRNPAVLLMDEPLSNLDAELRTQMRAEFRALQRRLGTTTIYVTHDQTEALSLADRVAVLRQGRIEQLGPPEEVYRRPASKFVGSLVGGMSFVPARLATPHAPSTAEVVGVRSEDVRIGPGGPDAVTMTGATVLTELVGRDRLVHIDVDGAVVRARLHADQPVGSELTVHVGKHDLHPFTTDGHRCPPSPMAHASPAPPELERNH
ncbi:ABC transporter ATP-binding protein [Nocardia sp. NPDC004711]